MKIDALATAYPTPLPTGVEPIRTAVHELFQAHHCEFQKRAFKLTRNANDAADLLQDTVERAIRHMPDGLTLGVAKCWFFVTMRNLFLDRQKAYETRCRADLSEDDFANIAASEPECTQSRDAKLQRDLYGAIDRLDESLRDVVHLRLLDELSLAEIAERLNLQPATIGSRLFRAKKKLHHMLLPESS